MSPIYEQLIMSVVFPNISDHIMSKMDIESMRNMGKVNEDFKDQALTYLTRKNANIDEYSWKNLEQLMDHNRLREPLQTGPAVELPNWTEVSDAVRGNSQIVITNPNTGRKSFVIFACMPEQKAAIMTSIGYKRDKNVSFMRFCNPKSVRSIFVKKNMLIVKATRHGDYAREDDYAILNLMDKDPGQYGFYFSLPVSCSSKVLPDGTGMVNVVSLVKENETVKTYYSVAYKFNDTLEKKREALEKILFPEQEVTAKKPKKDFI